MLSVVQAKGALASKMAVLEGRFAVSVSLRGVSVLHRFSRLGDVEREARAHQVRMVPREAAVVRLSGGDDEFYTVPPECKTRT